MIFKMNTFFGLNKKTFISSGFMVWENIKLYTARSISSKIFSSLRKFPILDLHQVPEEGA